MNSADLSAKALSPISIADFEFDAPVLSEKGKRNAGKVMKEIPLQRLQSGGKKLHRDRGSRYWWGEGIVMNRNSRVGGGFWTNMPPSQLDDLRQVTADHPAIFLFCYFEIPKHKLHVCAIPDEVTLRSLATVPENQSGVKTVYIDLRTQRFSQAAEALDLTSYYREIMLTDGERESLAAAIKQDAAAKELSAAEADDDDDDDSTSDDQVEDIYTQQTVDFLLDLANHTSDGEWHTENQDVYKQVLKAPSYALIERLRQDTISSLDSGVAATKRNASVLKKNDYGRGGYYDHYWAAFYDPEQSSKTKSCQLFFRMLAEQHEFRFGFAFGNQCDAYIANLHAAIAGNRIAVQQYLIDAPEGTVVGVDTSDDEEGIEARLVKPKHLKTNH